MDSARRRLRHESAGGAGATDPECAVQAAAAVDMRDAEEPEACWSAVGGTKARKSEAADAGVALQACEGCEGEVEGSGEEELEHSPDAFLCP